MGYGQSVGLGDSLRITFLGIPDHPKDSADLTVRLILKSLVKKSCLFYNRLEEGDVGDRFYNFNIGMEKMNNSVYKEKVLKYYRNNQELSTSDSLRHYDIPKKLLGPLQSDTLKLNLLDICYGFEKGAYRFKASLRAQTIQDTTTASKFGFPEDKIKYISSDWIYFVVDEGIWRVFPVHSN